MGERDHFISLEMASLGIERVAAWGCLAISERLAALTARLADGMRGNRVSLPDAAVRAPHILSLGFLDGMPKELIRKPGRGTSKSPQRLGACGSAHMFIMTKPTLTALSKAFHRLMPAA